MDNIIGIGEKEFRLVGSTLEEPIWGLHPVCFHDLRLNTWCKCPQHLFILKQFDFSVDGGADLEPKHDSIVNLESDTHSCPLSLLQGVFLLD